LQTNLLYIIDVSEDEKKMDGSDLVILAEQVSFLIQTRRQKVWFKKSIVKE
jgi:hypothetical protein